MKTCARCKLDFVEEHDAQTVCRICVTPRCPVCRWYIEKAQHDKVYCSERCRQRARAGAKYTIMGRDNYTCQKCGQKYDETKPQELKKLRVKIFDAVTHGDKPIPINTATFCDNCDPSNLPSGIEADLLRRTTFFQIDPNQPLGPISRQDMRRRKNK